MKTVSERKEFEEVGGYSPKLEQLPNSLNGDSSDSSESSSGNSDPPGPGNNLNRPVADADVAKVIESAYSPRPGVVRN